MFGGRKDFCFEIVLLPKVNFYIITSVKKQRGKMYDYVNRGC